ncbi:MAG: hypothetical protein IQL11_10920 [Bacteroidales bacterium]|nr:hypothetical protein [Bacteroidales bacterium]
MKRSFYLILIVGFLVSCKTQELYLSVIEPAPVTLSKDIRKVGIINRTTPTEATKVLDVIDKTLSLEGKELDIEGTRECIKGVTDELLNNSRFDEVKVLDDVDLRTPKLNIFPVPLSWEIVSRVCKEKGTDILFSLEMYDTDTRIGYSSPGGDRKTTIGAILRAVETQANMETIVKTGWRIYDPVGQIIADEFIYPQSVVFTGRGPTPLVAAAALIGRKEAVREVSNKAGHGYALRLIPFELRVMRDYFVKGTSNFVIAKRRARVGEWNAAGELWEKETANPKPKIAGRACHNMGIINEINGDVETALEWAQKAYIDYNIRKSLKYTRILENRLMKREILEEQQQQ